VGPYSYLARDADDLRLQQDDDRRGVQHPGAGERDVRLVLHVRRPRNRFGDGRGHLPAGDPAGGLQRATDGEEQGGALMAAETIAATEKAVASAPPRTSAGSFKRLVSNRIGSAAALVIAVLWTVPTFGLFISSLRPESAIKSSGWWTILSDPQFTLDNYERILAGATS